MLLLKPSGLRIGSSAQALQDHHIEARVRLSAERCGYDATRPLQSSLRGIPMLASFRAEAKGHLVRLICHDQSSSTYCFSVRAEILERYKGCLLAYLRHTQFEASAEEDGEYAELDKSILYGDTQCRALYE